MIVTIELCTVCLSVLYTVSLRALSIRLLIHSTLMCEHTTEQAAALYRTARNCRSRRVVRSEATVEHVRAREHFFERRLTVL